VSTYAQADYVAKEPGRTPQLGLCKRSTIYLQKGGSVYDLIAKLWPPNVPVYDLRAIDNGFHHRGEGRAVVPVGDCDFDGQRDA
jgi:hypothetical protein